MPTPSPLPVASAPTLSRQKSARPREPEPDSIASKRATRRRHDVPSETVVLEPSYVVRALQDDGTFYMPGERRPVHPPNGAAEHGGDVPSDLFEQLREVKKEILEVTVRLVDELTPLSADRLESYDQVHFFTNVHGHRFKFVDILNKITQAAENRAVGQRASTRPQMRVERLHMLQNLVQQHTEAQAYVFKETLNYLQHSRAFPNHIEEIRRLAASNRSSLNEIKDGAGACRKNATWVALERLSPDRVAALTGKPLVETVRLAEIGKQHGVFDGNDGDDFIQLEGKGLFRICAPLGGQTKRATAVIFWEKETADDDAPSSDKIIGAVVYSPDLISKTFAPDQEYSEAEKQVNKDFLMEKANVDRQRLVNGGKMAKGRGVQSIYGMPYVMKLPDHQDFSDGNVRIPIQAGETFIESRHEAFLEGFLPEFAALRKDAARRASLLNPLGYPSTSTFVTYGYAASAHLDRDACPTSGWVTHRPASLDRHTSNFVWASHGLVVELSPNAFWFWRAQAHEHGTTVHQEILTQPDLSYTKGYIKRNPDGAQWTRVSVLSEAVCKAHSR